MHTTAKLIKVVLVTVLIVIIVMLLLWKFSDRGTLLPDHAPDNIDENAIIEHSSNEKMDFPADGGGVSFDFTKEVDIDLSSATATLYFKNPERSLYDAVISLVVQDTVILQSGLLPPGSTLTSLSLPEKGVPLQEGGYNASIWVQFYDEHGEALAVNAQLQDVTVEVKE